MTNEIINSYGTITNLTCTTTALTSGNGQITDAVDNTTTAADKCKVYWRIETGGSAPVLGEVYRLYLIQEDNHGTQFTSAGVSLGDADITTEPTSARLVDYIEVTANANTFFYGECTIHDLPPTFGFVLWNATSQTASTTDADCFIHYQLVTPEIQDAP